jgi:hypothetical protein
MQAFLVALLLFPLLLHSHILVNRKSQPEKASLGSQLSKAKDKTPLDNPIMVLKVNDCTLKHSTQS